MSLVDIDRLEALLVAAAREGRTVTYGEVLRHFDKRVAPRHIYALCRDLGEVCARNRTRGEPELAVLVVRQADRLPGEGFFRAAWREGIYDGPCTGHAARSFIRAQTNQVFDFFARPQGSGEAEQREDERDDHDQADEIDDAVHGEASELVHT